MKMKALLLFLIIPFALSSCGHNPTRLLSLLQNGDLADVPAPAVGSSVSAYTRHTDSAEILGLISHGEPFLFYVGSDECSACLAFKPHLLRYIHETKTLVYYLDPYVNADYEEYADIWGAYQDVFLANLEIPYLMAIEDSEHFAKGATTKMTALTYEPFLNMMNGLVGANSIRSIATFASAEHYVDDFAQSLFFFYDRTDDEAARIYGNYIFPAAEKSATPLYLVDISSLEEADVVLLKEKFDLGDTIGPIAQYYEGGELVEPHLFGLDEVMDVAFLDQHLS